MTRVELIEALAAATKRATYARRRLTAINLRLKTTDLKDWQRDRLRERRLWWRGERARADALVAQRTKQLAALKVKTVSDAGLRMLIREEGSIPHAYNDPVGFATFGVGHLLHRSRVTAEDERQWGSKAKPKPELVMPTLRADIKRFEAAVFAAIDRKSVKQHEFDALVSLAFNIGTAGFAGSTVARKVREGRMVEAGEAFMLWDNPSMLRPRRDRERRLFLTGQYPA